MTGSGDDVDDDDGDNGDGDDGADVKVIRGEVDAETVDLTYNALIDLSDSFT